MAPVPNKSVEPSEGRVKLDEKVALNDYAVQVDEFIYDTISLAKIHPGGELFVKAFSGRDCTEAFLSYHRKAFPHDRMTDSLIGKASPLKAAGADADYLELCKLVEQVLPRNKAFAPAHYLAQSVSSLATLVRDMSGIARRKPEALAVTALCRMSGRFLPG